MKLRLFLTCWIVFSLHFATNVVREHYPAFSMIEDGDLVLDEYAHFHDDIFEHIDGHWYIGNQVAGGTIAAVPLVVFDPLLDYLQEIRVAQGPAPSADAGAYETPYPKRAEFFQRVRERGLDLRFGAATVVTSVFSMALFSAGLAVLIFGILERRGVEEKRALWLAFLFAFATPIFYRTAYLNHNLYLCATVFGCFLCVWNDGGAPLSLARRLGGGFLAGLSLALDYAGVIPLLAIFAYHVWTELASWQREDLVATARRSSAFVLGSVPPVLFLLYTQWAMYGDPFLPGQFWMPDEVNYATEGWRGMNLPDPEIYWLSLFGGDYGLYAFAPFLILGLVPARFAFGGRVDDSELILPLTERRFVALFFFVFLTFCAMNQYSRMQWNTGFRYLLPLVPFVFLQAADHLARMKTRTLVLISVPSLVHGWVLSMHRYIPGDRLDPANDWANTVVGSWQLFLERGVDFPWLNVVRSTPSIRFPLYDSPALPYLILGVAGLLVFAVWHIGRPGRPGDRIHSSPSTPEVAEA